MTTRQKTTLLFALWAVLAAGPAVAQAPARGEVVNLPAEGDAAAGREKRLRARVGVLAGAAMQKTQLELGASFDVAPLAPRLLLVADLTVGLRGTEVTFEPMAGVRFPFTLRGAPKLEPWVAGLAGLNLTVMRGGTALAVPVRLAAGAHYAVAPRVGVGGELAVEVGPLLAPFADAYAAAHFTVVVAFAL